MIDLHHGDALAVLADMDDDSISAVITDPPYGLSSLSAAAFSDVMARWTAGERDYIPTTRGFMGQAWDRFVPPPAMWDEVLRVLKPGGHLVAFAGARMSDVMGLSIRLAGFEVRDIMAWIHAQGMPLGARITADGYDDWATTLRPANEPIILARKPIRTSANTAMAEHGTGGLNIGATRGPVHTVTEGASNLGRWPANTVLSHAPGCSDETCIDGCVVAELDAQAGIRTSGANPSRRNADVFRTVYGTFIGAEDGMRVHRGAESGAASRFFPVFRFESKAPAGQRPKVNGISHSCVKPLALMEWLVALFNNDRDDFIVLDPFAGSGTTLEACATAGVRAIGIEAEADYLPLIAQRLARSGLTMTRETEHLWHGISE